TYTRIHYGDVLRDIYLNIPERLKRIIPSQERFTAINVPVVSVISKGVYVFRKLLKSGQADIDILFSQTEKKSERVALFLAILELCKLKRIIITENNCIKIRSSQLNDST
ncbi:MAG: hypothetical protein LBM93_06355, partial [Oscillospiraceae bacterium]|nr:hypothetical protein [Oscillospiraceae bacterium]